MQFHCTALAAAAAAGRGDTRSGPARPGVSDCRATPSFGDLRPGHADRTRAGHARRARRSGWIITSTGQTGAPVDFTITRFEMKYATDWQPLEMKLEARLKNAADRRSPPRSRMTTAINEITQSGRTVSKEDQISARTIVLPNNVFGSYEALAARLSIVAVGAEIPIYVAPQTEIKATVKAISRADAQRTGWRRCRPAASRSRSRIRARRSTPSWSSTTSCASCASRFLSVGLLVVRDDASSVATRAQTARNPTDADVSIPANGFNLAGTLTSPPGVAGRLRHPAVVLVGGPIPGRSRRVRRRASRCSRSWRKRWPTPA